MKGKKSYVDANVEVKIPIIELKELRLNEHNNVFIIKTAMDFMNLHINPIWKLDKIYYCFMDNDVYIYEGEL